MSAICRFGRVGNSSQSRASLCDVSVESSSAKVKAKRRINCSSGDKKRSPTYHTHTERRHSHFKVAESLCFFFFFLRSIQLRQSNSLLSADEVYDLTIYDAAGWLATFFSTLSPLLLRKPSSCLRFYCRHSRLGGPRQLRVRRKKAIAITTSFENVQRARLLLVSGRSPIKHTHRQKRRDDISIQQWRRPGPQ